MTRNLRSRILYPATPIASFLAIFAMIWWAAFVTTDSPLIFFDPISALLVLGGGLLPTLVSYTPREIARAVGLAISGGEDCERGRSARILEALRTYVLAAGALGFFTGFIGMLAMLDDPSQIGLGLAIALLSVFYAIVLGDFVLLPLRHRLAEPERLPPPGGPPRTGTALTASLGFVILGLLAFAFVRGALATPISNPGPRPNLQADLATLAAGYSSPELRMEVRELDGEVAIDFLGPVFSEASDEIPPGTRAIVALAARRLARSRRTVTIEVAPLSAADRSASTVDACRAKRTAAIARILAREGVTIAEPSPRTETPDRPFAVRLRLAVERDE